MKDSKKILVIEDHPDTLMLMSLVLKREGFSVVEATDGNDALKKLQSGLSPDLIFVDLKMPGCDGVEFMERFRKMPNSLKVPVFVTSGLDDIEDYTKDCGAQGFIEKPVDLDKLLTKVDQALTVKPQKTVSAAS